MLLAGMALPFGVMIRQLKRTQMLSEITQVGGYWQLLQCTLTRTSANCTAATVGSRFMLFASAVSSCSAARAAASGCTTT
jgi:hypothetical protein